MTEDYIQPWQLKKGDDIIFEGTHSACLSEKNGDSELIKNPEFNWIEED